jgi:hypothetical protein
MKPCTLETIRAGDRVVIDGWGGIVAFCSESGSYDADFPRSEWQKDEYSGVMVWHSGGALVLYPKDQFEGEGALSIVWEAPPFDPV